MMRITFLGTSAATAVPLPFCSCPVCTSARENRGKDIRKRSSLMINSDLLIDLGPDAVNACCKYGFDLSSVKYILQTHAHSDHFDAGHLVTRDPEYAGIISNELTVAASDGTLKAMNVMLKDEDASADLFSGTYQNKLKLRLMVISPGTSLKLGEYTVTAFDSHHDPMQEAVIYLIEHHNKKVLYGTDLLMLDDTAASALSQTKLDMLILDQTYGEGVNSGGHTNADQIYEIIDTLRCSGAIDENTKIYATHISHEGNYTHFVMSDIAAKHGYSIAWDGLTIEI